MASTHRKAQPPSWFEPKISLGMIVSVFGWIIFVAIWYATTNATLTNHDKAIDQLLKATQAESDQRGKIRDEFLVRTEKTNEGIAKLNEQTAVMATKYDLMVTTLTKISDQLAESARASTRK